MISKLIKNYEKSLGATPSGLTQRSMILSCKTEDFDNFSLGLNNYEDCQKWLQLRNSVFE